MFDEVDVFTPVCVLELVPVLVLVVEFEFVEVVLLDEADALVPVLVPVPFDMVWLTALLVYSNNKTYSAGK